MECQNLFSGGGGEGAGGVEIKKKYHQFVIYWISPGNGKG